MHRLAALTTLIALTTGCTAGEVGIWLMLFEVPEVDVGDQDCSENLNGADCVSTPSDGGSDWDVSTSGDSSPGASFAQITDGPGGEAYLVIANAVYVGSKAGGTYTFSWENFDNTETESEHTPSGYFLREENDSSRLTTMTFTRSGKRITGTQEVQAVTERTISESDTWTFGGTGPTSGQIGSEAYTYLDGDTSNYYDSADCSSSPCQVNIVSEQSWTTTFTGTRTDLTDDAFEGVQNAGQQPGSPQ